jgi:hypothetical protein
MQSPVSEHDTTVVLEKLSSSVRLSFASTSDEALPIEMGLLLMRLALLELLKKAAEDEAREPGPPTCSDELIAALKRSMGVGFAPVIG